MLELLLYICNLIIPWPQRALFYGRCYNLIMYLALIAICIIVLFFINWKIATPILVIIFCLDRVMDNYRRELEEKIKNIKK